MKFTITMKTEGKSLSRSFPSEGKVTLDADDDFIKKIVSETLKDFAQSPETIKVKAVLEL